MDINSLPPTLAAQIEELWSDGGERTGAAPDTFKRGCLAMWVVDSFALGDMARKVAALESNTVKRDYHDARVRQLQEQQLDLQNHKDNISKHTRIYRQALLDIQEQAEGDKWGDPSVITDKIVEIVKTALA